MVVVGVPGAGTVELPFDGGEFPFAFLQAFGNKETTIKKLRAGASNSSDLGGVLQRNHIHIAVCPPGTVTKTLAALKASPATAKAKARFILATDVGEASLVLPEEMRVPYAGVVDASYPSRLAERVEGLLAQPERLRAGEALISVAREKFDYTVLARRVRNVLERVVSSR